MSSLAVGNPSSGSYVPQLGSFERHESWWVYICRATRWMILKEIRRENVEKSIVEKGSQTTILRRVPKFELPVSPAREFSKRWNMVSIEGVYRPTSRNPFKRNSSGKFCENSRRLKRAHALHWRCSTQVRSPWYPSLGVLKDMKFGEYRVRAPRCPS